MPSPDTNRRHAQMGMAAALFCAAVAAIVLWRFPPEVYGFYPRCPVHEYLGVLCSGCGGTRAIAALLHGRFAEALRLNALLVGIVVPAAMVYVGVCAKRVLGKAEFDWPRIPKTAVFAGVGIAGAFMVVRNL